ncbi:methyl-accepting chemotaxis protein [Cellulosilyticum sp. I15G10I2]|uniref:methyl-accepting chemotaxis protein n=1 Tax=Cellulosilyticum sp. I15G10I2 TaxID=1892843 RepID=UPI00085BCAB1|nr:HAMP domain-containing methyl-accepting chemotaxis protein [Cellulosilyticum sp. I15G10I2]
MAKPKRLRNQITDRITLSIVIIITIVGFTLVSLTLHTAKSVGKFGLNVLGNVLSQNVNSEMLDTYFKDTVDTKNVEKIKSQIDSYYQHINNFVPTIYIASKHENTWLYIAGYESKTAVTPKGTLIHTPEGLIDATHSNQFTYSDHNMSLSKLESTLDLYIPLTNSVSHPTVMVIGLKTAIFSQIILGIILSILAFLGILISVIRFATMATVKHSTKDIDALVKKMNELSDFKGDLTKRVEISSQNEVGLLAQDTNKMLDSIGDFLKNVSDVTHILSNSGHEYAQIMISITNSTQTIQERLRRTVDRIKEQSSSTENISARIYEVQQAVETVAISAQSVNENVYTTVQRVKRGQDSIEEVQRHTLTMIDDMKETNASVSTLEMLSNQITDIVDTMVGIAGQTNLLALNASIEAARAGESGRGFAVVAEEVRKLAESSALQSQDIAKLIHSVQDTISNVSKYVSSTSMRIDEEQNLISSVNDEFDAIVTDVEQISDKVQNVYGATEEMVASTTVVSDAVQHLTHIADENTNDALEVSSQMNAQAKNIQNISDSISSLSALASKLDVKMKDIKL